MTTIFLVATLPKPTLGEKFLCKNPEERKRKISEGNKGKKRTLEARRKISLARLGKHYPKLSEAKRGKPILHPNLQPSDSLAYITGAVLGDGYIRESPQKRHHSVILSVIDELFAKSFASATRELGLHPTVWQRGKYWLVEVYSISLIKYFEIVKTNDVREFIRGYEPSFLKGFYEAEGCCWSDHGVPCIDIGNMNRNLMDAIHEMICSLGLHPKIRTRKDGYTILRLQRKAEVLKFLNITNPVIKRWG